MTRTEYQTLRRTYRILRRKDAAWRPDPYAARNTIERRQYRAEAFCGLVDMPIAATFFRPLRNAGRGDVRLPRGPKAQALCAPHRSGRYVGMELHKRVALRRALRQSAALRMERAA